MNNTKIIVRDFILPARIGIYPEEHLKSQNIRFNITMDLGNYSVTKDEIEETVSYVDIINEVRAQAIIHHELVETFAEQIAMFALKDKRVKEVSVQLEKLEAFPDAHVGCIITRSQS